MEPECATDILQSLNNEIATALQNGASPEDISRLVNTASEKIVRRTNGGTTTAAVPKKHHQESRARSKYVFRFGLLIFSLAVAVSNVLVSTGYTSSAATFLMEEMASQPQVNKMSISNTSNTSRLDHEKSHLDFETIVLNNNTDTKQQQKKYPCPFDVFFDDDCIEGDGGTTCIFRNAVLKKIKPGEYQDQEFEAFERLNDTRYFPKLYYADKECGTFLQENVRPRGEIENMWCSSNEYYKDFYVSLFTLFTEKNVIPVDLNVCCNTIVNHDHIRIIDFNQYEMHHKPLLVRATNRKMLADILKDLDQIMKEEHWMCEDREIMKRRANATATRGRNGNGKRRRNQQHNRFRT